MRLSRSSVALMKASIAIVEDGQSVTHVFGETEFNISLANIQTNIEKAKKKTASLERQMDKLDSKRRKREKDVLQSNLNEIEVLRVALLSFQEEQEAALAASNLEVSLFALLCL